MWTLNIHTPITHIISIWIHFLFTQNSKRNLHLSHYINIQWLQINQFVCFSSFDTRKMDDKHSYYIQFTLFSLAQHWSKFNDKTNTQSTYYAQLSDWFSVRLCRCIHSSEKKLIKWFKAVFDFWCRYPNMEWNDFNFDQWNFIWISLVSSTIVPFISFFSPNKLQV